MGSRAAPGSADHLAGGGAAVRRPLTGRTGEGMSLKRDYMLRIIEQLTQALGRILALRKKGDASAAIREAEGAASAIAGMDLRMAASVDAATLSRTVTDPVRMAALARLMHERAAIDADRGDATGESAWRRRAAALWRAAEAAGAELDEVALEALRSEPGGGGPSGG